MSKLLTKKRKYPYNFGRVFFPDSQVIPEKILFQPLGNHVGNVVKLVKLWDKKDFPDQSSLERVIEASKIHDMAKPQTFSLQVETNKKEKFKKYIYSFKGHRFKAQHDDLWIETLAQGHHNFSTDCVTNDAYKLRKYKNYQDILNKDSLAYAKELYILEMCDQIEAELACLLKDKTQGEERTFMEYTIKIDENNPNIYRIDPFPFSDDLEYIELTFKYWVFTLLAENKEKLQQLIDKNEENKLGKTLDEIVKDWWEKVEAKPQEEELITIQLKPYQSLNCEYHKDCDYWYQNLTKFQTPNPMQREVFTAITNNEDIAVLLKAPTGVGKLEAVLIPTLALGYRLILPLPTRSLLEDHQERIENYLKKLSKLYPQKEFSLVVDTGSQMYRYIYFNGEKVPSRVKNPRRHLYKGDVILTTLDKFMYRYFGYGDKQKSFIFPLRINDNQNKTIICFDEAHSYDNLAFTNFCNLVKALYETGRNLVLMTATLPKNQIPRFDYLQEGLIDYIDNIDNKEKLDQFLEKNLKQPYPNEKILLWKSEVAIQASPEGKESNNFQQEFINLILNEWQSQENHRLITVVEKVKDAVEIYKQVKEELGTNLDDEGRFLFLYHGRISDTPKDKTHENYQYSRSGVYQQIKQRDNDQKPYLIITTSAIEVGCDLNCQTLITQLCPPENLIQRAGRCNRKGNIANAKVIIIGDSIPDFLNTLTDSELQLYQEKLRSHHSQNFNANEIMKCVSQTQQVDDYRVVELFSQLQEYVYEANLTCKPTHEKGLVITRSWIPSATLIYEDAQITVPLDRLIVKKDQETDKTNQYANVTVEESYYDQETTQWKTRTLRWGNAYQKNIIIKINKSQDGIVFDAGFHEYDYNAEFGFVDLPGVFVKWKPKNFEQQLAYKDGDKTIAVINYITPNND
ncbi:CRISPR-associated helicase Cas3' [Cyanobacterium aponinum]|uniref:CRISPR-associated helicase Cas3 n=1 Tax=Cyanobacterium aponinum (strain PCC 10605) TaxID=755178 RepID=K9Z848_CYAAP|nr:CRISPR-associated helicase Cas3' [Cyanobacterium aponinum]AFZ54740.1 CRISPR-associated helicase Cas3 [Cyanobacterium aponinum PCC 10605]